MNTIDLVRSQYKGAHDLMEATMSDVSPEHAHWAPPGVANPLGATYFHTIVAEDFLLSSRARDVQPLIMGEYAAKSGASEPPPSPGPELAAWERRVKVDVAQAREYAQAVYQRTDDWLASLSPADLEKEIDMSGFGMGQQPMHVLVASIVLQHINNHLGEISCLKGLQGAKGYPF
ncbi:MAG: DinB family protein [Dehalococcoidia bacterium]